MTEKETLSNQKINLRRQAEEKAAGMAENLEALSPEETRRILHELRVHQIELEMQNEELHDTQAKLDAARARYFNLYDLAPVGYCTLSEKGLILEANLTAATLLGMVRCELVRQPISRFIHEEDQNTCYLLFKQIFKTHSALRQGMDRAGSEQTGSEQAGAAPRAYELRMVKHDGSPFWALLSAIAADDAGGAPVISITLSDISELKQAEEALREKEGRFRKLFERHSAVKLVIDPETGNIVDANEAAARFYGWPLQELKRMRIQQINVLPPEAVRAEMEKAVLQESGRFEFRHRCGNGDIRDVEVFINRIEIAGKGLLYSIVHDISERKRAEASQRESDEALRALLSQKEVLLKEVHHRVNNNLQVVSSLISLQADKLTGAQLQGGLREVRDRVQAIALVHKVLHQSDDMSLLDFAGYAVSLMQYLWRVHDPASGKVRLYMSIAPLMMPVEAATSCGLILTELISNVFKHAFPNGGAGEVAVTLAHDAATRAVCMRVRDNGVGLPADMNWRQPDTLGLRLVQMLANQIHGAIQAGPVSEPCSEPDFDPGTNLGSNPDSNPGSNPGPGAEFQVNFKL